MREITTEEVERVLKGTKIDKAPGLDGVRAEMMKGGITVVRWLVRLFNVQYVSSHQ